MTSGTRGKWSAVGTIVAAPVRGYYYPGRVHAIKRSVDLTSPALYSIIFSNPLGSLDPPETGDQGLILDFSQSEIIGRGFEPITKALLSENQKVFITFRGREVSARVEKHEQDDTVNIILDGPESLHQTVKLHELRLLPSRKSGRIQEHPDYSQLANGRRSPTEMDFANAATNATAGMNGSTGTAPATVVQSSHPVRIQKTGRRRTTSSSLLETGKELPSIPTPYSRSAHIDVPSGTGARKRRPSQNQAAKMDECTAALVLMSLSASPRSPTFLNERLSLYRCTFPGCAQERTSRSVMEKHVRDEHLSASENAMGEEEFYYTEIDLQRNRARHPSFPQMSLSSSFTNNHIANSPNIYALSNNSQTAGIHSSSGPDSPLSLSEDAASTSSSGVMTMGDNSMDSSPPASPLSGHNPPSQYSRSSGASSLASSGAIAVPASRYGLDDHDYFNRKSSEGMSLLSSSAGSPSASGRSPFGAIKGRPSGNGRTSHGMSLLSSLPSTSGVAMGPGKTRPINIPSGSGNESLVSSSFGGFAGSHGSMASSGFGSFQSFGAGSPLSPVKLSSSLSNSSKYLKLSSTPRSLGAPGSGAGGVHLIQQANRTSPTKRVRGEMRKCRKVYGMEKKDAWCTQCKWKKACTRFQD